MKSTTFAAALLASVAVAQPHGHQRRHKHHDDQLEKRELVVEWETVWETATVYVDETTTETVFPEQTPEVAAESAAPAATTSTGVPGQFFETPTEQPTTLATSTSAPPPPAETSTQAPPAPTTTSTPEPEPTTTTTAPVVAVPTIAAPPPVVETTTSSPAPEPTTSAAPPAETGSGSGSGGSTGGGSGSSVSGKGEITYYAVGLGACGYDDSGEDDKENIVAMPIEMWTAVSSATNYGLNMPAHPWCDKTVTITANGKSIQAKVRDNCPGCSGASIDVTEHAFLALFGSLDAGREEVEWSMN